MIILAAPENQSLEKRQGGRRGPRHQSRAEKTRCEQHNGEKEEEGGPPLASLSRETQKHLGQHDATAWLGHKFEAGGCSALDVLLPKCLWDIQEP